MSGREHVQQLGSFPGRSSPPRALRLAVPALVVGLLAAACSSGGPGPASPGTAPATGASPPAGVGRTSASPGAAGSPGSLVGSPAASAPTTDDSSPSPASAAVLSRPEEEPAAPPTPTLPPGAIRLVRVANTEGQGANLRAEPSAASRRVKVVRDGSELELIGPDRQAEGRTWRNVQDDDGQAGWILSELLVDERVAGPRPTPTPAPPTIQVTDITSPVNRGEPATLTIVTRPGIRCEVRVLLYGPGTVPRAGLEPRVANESGECSWTWTVPPDTVPGAWRYAVAVGSGDQRTTREVSFGVR